MNPAALRRFLRRRVDQPEAAEDDQHAADLLDPHGALRGLAPFQVVLDPFVGRARQHDDAAVPHPVHQEQERAVQPVGGRQLEGDRQHRGHEGEGAGAEGDAEHQPQNERGQQAPAASCSPGPARRTSAG